MVLNLSRGELSQSALGVFEDCWTGARVWGEFGGVLLHNACSIKIMIVQYVRIMIERQSYLSLKNELRDVKCEA